MGKIRMSKLTKIILIAQVPIFFVGAFLGLLVPALFFCIALNIVYFGARLVLYLMSLWYDYGDDDED